MNKFQTFQEFLSTQSIKVPIYDFFINILITALLAYLLSLVYSKYGRSISNRKIFAKNFILLAVMTMLIITIVKSSLALSLGLVGALSIVRFRAAIKEPEELIYLFCCIGIGLGLGADQRVITVSAFIFISALIAGHGYFYRKNTNHNLFLTIFSKSPSKETSKKLVDLLKDETQALKLRRLDESQENLEASFLVEFSDFEQLERCKSKLQEFDEKLNITFLDNTGLS